MESNTTLINAGDTRSETYESMYNDGLGITLAGGQVYTLAYDYDFGDNDSYEWYLSQDGTGGGLGFGVGKGPNPGDYAADAYVQRKTYSSFGGVKGHATFSFKADTDSRFPYFAWRPLVTTSDNTPRTDADHPITLSITNLALWQGPECIWQPNSRDAFIYLQKLQTQLQGGTTA